MRQCFDDTNEPQKIGDLEHRAESPRGGGKSKLAARPMLLRVGPKFGPAPEVRHWQIVQVRIVQGRTMEFEPDALIRHVIRPVDNCG